MLHYYYKSKYTDIMRLRYELKMYYNFTFKHKDAIRNKVQNFKLITINI